MSTAFWGKMSFPQIYLPHKIKEDNLLIVATPKMSANPHEYWLERGKNRF